MAEMIPSILKPPPTGLASLRRTQDTTPQQDTQSSKPRSPSKGSPKKPKSPQKPKSPRKSKSSSSPLPKSVLVTPRNSPKKSPKSRRRVKFYETDHVHEIEDAPASDGEATAQPEPQTLVPGFVWPLKFPEYSQLLDVCKTQSMSTFDGQRGILSLESHSSLKEAVNKEKPLVASRIAARTLCNDVFVQTFEQLKVEQEAGAVIETNSELTEVVNQVADIMLPWHNADLRTMLAPDQENLFERVGADDHSITNPNFFMSAEELQANKMGPQFIHENLNPVRRGSSGMIF